MESGENSQSKRFLKFLGLFLECTSVLRYEENDIFPFDVYPIKWLQINIRNDGISILIFTTKKEWYFVCVVGTF